MVNEYENGDEHYFLLRYEPTREWYSATRDLKNYSGKITFYTLNAKKLGEMELVNGTEKPSNDKSCVITLKDVWCFGGTDDATPASCTYTYQISCGGGGSGYSHDYSNPNYGDPGYIGGGGGNPDDGNNTGGGPGDIITNPIIDENGDLIEEEVVIKVINELDDPCASLIFNQLQLLSMSYELPEIVDNNPDLESLQFSQAILNMFNDVQKFDYIVRNDTNFSDDNVSASTQNRPYFNTNTGNYEITTTFNTTYLNNSSRLSIARTTIHETIHAYLVFMTRNEPIGTIRDALNTYATNNGYPMNSLGVIHHNFMAQFVDSVAYQLYLWNANHGTGANLDWQYYHDMAWGGLITDTNGLFYNEFINHNPELKDQNRIMDIIRDEATNANNSSGNGNDCQ